MGRAAVLYAYSPSSFGTPLSISNGNKQNSLDNEMQLVFWGEEEDTLLPFLRSTLDFPHAIAVA